MTRPTRFAARWRRRLQRSDSHANSIARKCSIGAASTAVIAFLLSGVTVLAPDYVQWSFTILFWLALIVAVPAIVAVVITGSSTDLPAGQRDGEL